MEEKREYIIRCMNNTIDKMMSNWKERIEMRERKNQDIEKNERELKKIEENSDAFHWLNLRTKYDSLKKKLRQIIIEKLNDVSEGCTVWE